MSERQPLRFQWNGEAMIPAAKVWQRRCDERFVVGEFYTLEEIHARSTATHAHYFAVLRDAWMSLPDNLAAQFPSAEHLRKFALIKAGFADRRSIHASSVPEARKLAAFVRPMDEFAIVTTEGSIITIWTAQSQDHRHMDKATFQASKEAVLNVVSDMIGTDIAELGRNAPQIATANAGAASRDPEALTPPEDETAATRRLAETGAPF